MLCIKVHSPISVGPREDLQKADTVFFLPLHKKKIKRHVTFQGLTDIRRESILSLSYKVLTAGHKHTSLSFILAFQYNKSLAPPLDLQGHDSNQRVLPCPDLHYP